MAALAVDIGYLNVAKNELQNIVDASALAGAGELSRQYLDPSFAEDVGVDYDAIRTIAENVADSNETGFIVVVQIGTWIERVTGDDFADTDDTADERPNAVKVIALRDDENNSPVPAIFAGVFDIADFDVAAYAVAALTGASTIAEGELEIPVGISRQWFEDNFCDQDIQFYPTSGTTGCAGWHVYEEWPSNATKLRDDILGGMLVPPVPPGTEPFTPPPLDLNTETPPAFAFTGGNLSTTLDNMVALFEQQCVPQGGPNCTWYTEVVVYDEPCGENPNQTVTIVGFASVEITKVDGPPPVLTATAKCGQVTPGTGGGNYYGTWGSIPGLVE